MTSDSQAPDPYDAVLADIKGKRDQLNQMIEMLEAMRGVRSIIPSVGFAVAASSAAAVSQNMADQVDQVGQGDFLGMTIPDATKKLLKLKRKQLGNAEIFLGLKAGGLVLNSAEPTNTIGSVLTRRFHQVGDIVRVGRGVWGLKEWYPNRSFKQKPNGDVSPVSTASEQPSERPESDPLS